MNKTLIWNRVDADSDVLCGLAREIWEHPELALEEAYAAERQAKVLSEAGLRVTLGVGVLPTAIMAEYGSGSPVIGILGEYDALAGLSQAAKPTWEPIIEGGAGHGCGHNLLGTAGVGAAIAIKEAIDSGEVKGTVRYYGCPAEEDVGGKLYLLRDGFFDDCDAVLYWHPSCISAPWRSGNLADVSARFTFKGISAHAAQPQLGRSALDAVELMNVGANYLREHVDRDVYLHYSIIGNGIAPNTVPDHCEVWYMMRAPKREILDQAFDRLCDIARGAALMAGTELVKIDCAKTSEVISNGVLADLLLKNMRELGGQRFTQEEVRFAEELSKEVTAEAREQIGRSFGIPPEDRALLLQEKISCAAGEGTMPFSGDFDVSWVVPFGAFNTATWPTGIFTHTWQSCACAGSSIGMNGMLFAAKVIAGTVLDLMSDPGIVKSAKEELEQTLNGRKYAIGLSEGSVPHRSEM